MRVRDFSVFRIFYLWSVYLFSSLTPKSAQILGAAVSHHSVTLKKLSWLLLLLDVQYEYLKVPWRNLLETVFKNSLVRINSGKLANLQYCLLIQVHNVSLLQFWSVKFFYCVFFSINILHIFIRYYWVFQCFWCLEDGEGSGTLGRSEKPDHTELLSPK